MKIERKNWFWSAGVLVPENVSFSSYNNFCENCCTAGIAVEATHSPTAAPTRRKAGYEDENDEDDGDYEEDASWILPKEAYGRVDLFYRKLVYSGRNNFRSRATLCGIRVSTQTFMLPTSNYAFRGPFSYYEHKYITILQRSNINVVSLVFFLRDENPYLFLRNWTLLLHKCLACP